MRRLSAALDDHGLSFGDALNIALFLLTIFSLFLAYEGVRIAGITLDEAHRAAQDQETQFKQQIDQLTKSSSALETARSLLQRQSEALQSLQGISRQQLRDLNKAEGRLEKQERARPAPHVEAYCASGKFIDASGRQLNELIVNRAVKIYVPTETPNRVPCQVRLTNDGDGELKNKTLELHFSCIGEAKVGVLDPRRIGEFSDPDATFFQGKNVPAGSASDRILIEKFVLFREANCVNIEVRGSLESDNFHAVDFSSHIQELNPR